MQSTSSHGEVRLVGGVEEKRDEFALICEGGRYRLERLESVVTGLKPLQPIAAAFANQGEFVALLLHSTDQSHLSVRRCALHPQLCALVAHTQRPRRVG